MSDPTLTSGFDLPFDQQSKFFAAKINLPTDRWDDIEKSAHDRAFIVAGAKKADLLKDFHDAIQAEIDGGGDKYSFAKKFRDIVKNRGWTGWTGEGTKQGEAWRSKVIIETNIRTAYAAGRLSQLRAIEPDYPFWTYVHNDSVTHYRPMHKQWGDMRLCLRSDHPFWQTHYAPCGWGCRCRITVVFKPDDKMAKSPPDGWDVIDPKTGEQVGIDKGWGYMPGANAFDDNGAKPDRSLLKMVQDKLIKYPPAISKALTHSLQRKIDAETNAASFIKNSLAKINTGIPSKVGPPLFMGFAQNADKIKSVTGIDTSGYYIQLPDNAPRHVEKHHGKDGGNQRPPAPEDYNLIPELVNTADSIELADTINQTTHIKAIKKIGTDEFHGIFAVRKAKDQ
ncbi:MAG: phage minor head protein, partial [Alphaproteobacteria bacterium]|nr:phage minor head protein [Alphaproteobacteria bacterium]